MFRVSDFPSSGALREFRISRQAENQKLKSLLGSGLSDPDLSLAGTVHLFAWAGIDRPAALNGPQYLADTLVENDFIPETDVINVPTGPGLGLTLDSRAEAALSIVAEI